MCIRDRKWEDIDLDFGVVTVAKGSTKRVLRLDGALKELLFGIKNDNSQGLILSKAFTRQWLYKQIQSYVGGCGLSGVTAQALRQQYILRPVSYTHLDVYKRQMLYIVAAICLRCSSGTC